MSDENERSVASAGSVGEVLAKGIADIIRIATEPDWIPVSERLPEAGQTVMLWNYVDHRLGWLKYTANGVAYFFSTQDECNIEPPHWMPLPAPPSDGK
jgi:hypothetical protein